MFTKEKVDSMKGKINEIISEFEKNSIEVPIFPESILEDSDVNALQGIYNSWKGKYVIIRSYASGVHFGILDIYDPVTRHVLLKNCRRIWNWSGALTLTEISISGIKSGKLSKFKDEMIIAQVEEIIPVNQESKECLLKFPEHST